MSDAEARFVKGNQTGNWKKAVPCRICLQAGNWTNMEVKDNFGVKAGIKDVTFTDKPGDKPPFLTVTYGKGETFSFTSDSETLKRFYCGISLILGKEDVKNQTTYQDTIKQFQAMIENEKKFFSSTDFQQPPQIPPEPSEMPTL